MEWVIVAITVLAYMSWVCIVSWKSRRLDIVDVAWAGAFIIAACVSLLLGSRGWLQYFITGLVVLWGVRLGLYILRRLRHSKKEDPRYAAMRKRWKGSFFLNAYFRIFVVQAFLAFVVILPVLATNFSPATNIMQPLVFIGGLLWVGGFLFESISDTQLHRHLLEPKNKNKLMTKGLWRYTRHPNYFGESLQWWGIYIIALGATGIAWTIIGPLLITFLLLFVSGIPLTEKRFEDRQGWQEYKKRTSVFLPLPPRRG